MVRAARIGRARARKKEGIEKIGRIHHQAKVDMEMCFSILILLRIIINVKMVSKKSLIIILRPLIITIRIQNNFKWI